MIRNPTRDQAQPLGEGGVVVAFDVGRTDTKAALFDTTGRMLGLSRTPTPHRGADPAEAVLERVQELTLQFARDFPDVTPIAAGLIAPGLVDDDHGIGIHAANLHWKDVPFKRLAEARLDSRPRSRTTCAPRDRPNIAWGRRARTVTRSSSAPAPAPQA